MIFDLILKLERSAEPDRALDEDVLSACGWTMDSNDDGEVVGWYDPKGVLYSPLDIPKPTASLDAAMTLVQEDEGDKELYWGGNPDDLSLAQIERPYGRFHQGRHKSLAVALCIAELRARAA